jgi:hypothetical protein
MLQKKFHLACLWMVVAAATTTVLSAGEASGGFGIGPGMVLIENIKPGDGDVDVAGKTGFTFEVLNDTNEKQLFNVSSRMPKTTISSWELGYESVSDPSWLILDKKEIEVAAKSKGNVKMTLKVPDKAEYYNRKWMGIVACAPGAAKIEGGSSVGLVVASRVQIETLSRDDVEPAGGDIGLAPSSWMMSDAKSGDSWRKVFKIRNNTKEDHTYMLKRIGDVEKDEKRHARYYGQNFIAVEKDFWGAIKDADKPFALKPGETKELSVMVSCCKDAQPNKFYEELLFIQDEKANTNFIRIRTETNGPTAANADDGKKTP